MWITRYAKDGIIFCEQMSWITRSTKWVRLALGLVFIAALKTFLNAEEPIEIEV